MNYLIHFFMKLRDLDEYVSSSKKMEFHETFLYRKKARNCSTLKIEIFTGNPFSIVLPTASLLLLKRILMFIFLYFQLLFQLQSLCNDESFTMRLFCNSL